jgi:hypothetical protein
MRHRRGSTPIIGTLLADRFAGQWLPLAVFFTALSTLSLIGVCGLSRLRGEQQESTPPSHVKPGVSMSKPHNISDAEWQARCELAALYHGGALPHDRLDRYPHHPASQGQSITS